MWGRGRRNSGAMAAPRGNRGIGSPIPDADYYSPPMVPPVISSTGDRMGDNVAEAEPVAHVGDGRSHSTPDPEIAPIPVFEASRFTSRQASRFTSRLWELRIWPDSHGRCPGEQSVSPIGLNGGGVSYEAGDAIAQRYGATPWRTNVS